MTKPSASKPNYLYSIISVTLMLLLLGLFGLLVLQGSQMVKKMKEQVEIIIELKEGSGGNDVEQIRSFLAKSSFYKEGSAKYISREDGARMMQKEFGDAFLKLDMANPLYDVVTFNMNADFVNADGMAEIKKTAGWFFARKRCFLSRIGSGCNSRKFKDHQLLGIGDRGVFYHRRHCTDFEYDPAGAVLQPFFDKKHGTGGRFVGLYQQAVFEKEFLAWADLWVIGDRGIERADLCGFLPTARFERTIAYSRCIDFICIPFADRHFSECVQHLLCGQ